MTLERKTNMREIQSVANCILLLLFIGCTLLYPKDLPAKIDDEIGDVIEDEEEAGDLFKKEMNWAPVPTIISDPTLGTGLALALMYLHPQKEGDDSGRSNITGVAGMYTSTDSWMGAVFHNGSYLEDRYRISGGVAYGEFNLKYYGIGNDSPIRDNPIDFNAKTTLFMPKVLLRLPIENWFAGPSYHFMKIDNTFDFSSLLPILPESRIATQTAGLGLTVSHDSRDNNMWAYSGNWFELTLSDYGQYLGGDFDYQKLKAKFVHYIPVGETTTVAYRLDGQVIGGSAPFYDLASLNLRGFPMGLYSDKVAATAQVQGNWRFRPRWIALAFGGGGRIADDISDLGGQPTRWAGGMGLRYVLNEKQRLSLGVDVTYGNDEIGIYIQMGDGLAR
jgi:hypothetical protein